MPKVKPGSNIKGNLPNAYELALSTKLSAKKLRRDMASASGMEKVDKFMSVLQVGLCECACMR